MLPKRSINTGSLIGMGQKTERNEGWTIYRITSFFSKMLLSEVATTM